MKKTIRRISLFLVVLMTAQLFGCAPKIEKEAGNTETRKTTTEEKYRTYFTRRRSLEQFLKVIPNERDPWDELVFGESKTDLKKYAGNDEIKEKVTVTFLGKEYTGQIVGIDLVLRSSFARVGYIGENCQFTIKNDTGELVSFTYTHEEVYAGDDPDYTEEKAKEDARRIAAEFVGDLSAYEEIVEIRVPTETFLNKYVIYFNKRVAGYGSSDTFKVSFGEKGKLIYIALGDKGVFDDLSFENLDKDLVDKKIDAVVDRVVKESSCVLIDKEIIDTVLSVTPDKRLSLNTKINMTLENENNERGTAEIWTETDLGSVEDFKLK